uniref:Uncharacterized protein n=1 Tax=Stegastes partitus TaxID=144197 RepID=A0A3B5B7A2_9TELE
MNRSCYTNSFLFPQSCLPVQTRSAGPVEEEPAAAESQQEVRDEAGRLLPAATHQRSQAGGRRQLLVSGRKCRNHCGCDSDRFVKLE